jgi:hypothetical protein
MNKKQTAQEKRIHKFNRRKALFERLHAAEKIKFLNYIVHIYSNEI